MSDVDFSKMKYIDVKGAREHNLKSISLRIPRDCFVLVTGVSGSGKSSLVQNIIANEGQRLYISQLNSRAREYFGRMSKPELDSIQGISPVVSLDQLATSSNSRSTVGTLSELYDMLRLLYARFAASDERYFSRPNRSLFSFNQQVGACPECSGLGREEFIDPNTFIVNPEKSVLNGALSLTNPSGYVIYSQVTLDVLVEVCRAEGFDLGVPWNDLDEREKDIILYGSEKIKIPFGKHPLESRMKWSGITAKPRDEGYYRGMIPIMEEILKRDRNKNILKYTRSRECKACQGKRLNSRALNYRWQGQDISAWTVIPIEDLNSRFSLLQSNSELQDGEMKILSSMLERMEVITKLGIDYLTLDRESSTLSVGEVKRLRLSTLIQETLCGVIYTLDEPTVGLHPRDHENLLGIMRDVCDRGNSLIVIDHKNIGFDFADYWIELGPGAGYKGGELLVAGDSRSLDPIADINNSLSLDYLTGARRIARETQSNNKEEWISVNHADVNNLQKFSVRFKARALNIICGVSGAGKTSLMSGIIFPLLSGEKMDGSSAFIEQSIPVDKILIIDQKPIGRNSRSNPATYTKLFDRIRDLYGKLPEVADRGWDKSRFSFNVDGGRCPECAGAGATELGVSYLGSVEIICESCKGKRFMDETLEILYKGKNIYEVLEMEVDEALDFFSSEKAIFPYLDWLSRLGLGYLKLGQPSGTLSGGEAQRIKLATELVRKSKGHTVYLLDEPASGLHPHDIQVLMDSLDELVKLGHTLIMIEHDPDLISLADWLCELGPDGGRKGGNLIFSGTPEEMYREETPMAVALKKNQSKRLKRSGILTGGSVPKDFASQPIVFEGVRTNNLKGINISIPKDKITAITGVSGSGKTSLVYDTIYASAQYYFSQTFSPYVRNLIGGNEPGDFQSAKGLIPALAIQQKVQKNNPRSTLATLSGILPVMRLIFSRFAIDDKGRRSGLLGREFSFNDKSGACISCAGLGEVKIADPERIITHPGLSVFEGALQGTRAGKFFADPNGQYIATLQELENKLGKDFSSPWDSVDLQDKNLILYGFGNTEFDVTWNYKRKGLSGSHHFKAAWKGFVSLIEEEYIKRSGTTRQAGLESVMRKASCPDCAGKRIRKERLKYYLHGNNISDWLELNVDEFFEKLKLFTDQSNGSPYSDNELSLITNSVERIFTILSIIKKLGMGYLELNRSVSSLSSGEYQRVYLSSQLGSELTGLLYLIDEPSTALHPSNLKDLLEVFQAIRKRGNTIVMVDHNPMFYNNADIIYELGPGGGERGGEVINQTEKKNGGFIKPLKLEFPAEQKRNGFNSDDVMIKLSGSNKHNLKLGELKIPHGWTCIAGVSGSGKSTLMEEIIKYLPQQIDEEKIITSEKILSNWQWYHTPLFGLGIFDRVRKEFCSSLDNQNLKVKPDFFMLTRKGGRCEDCQGKGHRTISLDFFGSSKIVCDACSGTGYNQEARRIKSHGMSFDQFLQLPLAAIQHSAYWPGVQTYIELAVEMGLGYLKAGQSGNSLSPGEKQRLLLVRELIKGSGAGNVYLFDEPTRGLDVKDAERFIKLVKKLVENGNSVLMVEHHPELLMNSDWIIELGPGGGFKGGELVYSGDPKGMINNVNSPTGKVLVGMINN